MTHAARLAEIRRILTRMARDYFDEPGKTGIPEADRIYRLTATPKPRRARKAKP